MKLIKRNDIEPITPHPEVELYRYRDLMDGVSINVCYQLPHTARQGATPVANICMVLEGSLEVECAGSTFTMCQGDAAYFEANEDKSMMNNSDSKVMLLLIDKGMGGGPGGPGGPPPANN